MHRTLVPFLLCTSLWLPWAAQAQAFDTAGEQAMLEQINAQRAQAQLGPLTRDARLDAAARAHSQDMAAQQQLMHVSPVHGTPADRVRGAGLEASSVLENVALHRSAGDAFQALMQSDSHRANMLNPDVSLVGLGALPTERGVYVTQLFAAPAPPPVAAPPVAAPPAVAPPVAAPPVAAPPVAAPPAAPPSAPQPRVQAPAPSQYPAPASIEEQAGSGGTVLIERDAQGAAQAYWVFGSGRWWYYPLPPGAAPGQRLQPDRSVTGPPPGVGGLMQPPMQGPMPPMQPPMRPMPPPPPPVAAPMLPPPPPQRTIVIDPFRGAITLPGGAYYSVPPPPYVGQPTRAWQRAQDRWQRAYQRWLEQQQRLQRRAL